MAKRAQTAAPATTETVLVARLDDLLSRTNPTPTGCWEWARTRRPTGYGRVQISRGRHVPAHRAVWLASGRSIPAGLEFDHLCRNRACVNPEHLELVTRAENNRRKALAQTTCRQGHPLSGDNLVSTAGQRRRCRTCKNAEALRRNSRLRREGFVRVGTRMVQR